MFKLIIITAFAVAVFASWSPREYKKKSVKMTIEERSRQQCKNVSGVELEFGRNERLYEEYTECSMDALNATQLEEEIDAILQKLSFKENQIDIVLDSSSIKPIFQKYCPKMYTLHNCTQKLFPIINECYTAEEKLGQTVWSDVYQHLNDFFCKNDASRVTEFINGKVLECVVAKKLELMACYDAFLQNSIYKVNMDSLFWLLPPAETTCNSLKTLGNCTVPILQQCELSETPAKLFTLLFNSIQTDTRCASVNSTQSTLS